MINLKSLCLRYFSSWLYFIGGASLLPFLFNFLNYHYHLITFAVPLEFRESAMIYTTHLLLQGQNPFDLAHFPQATNSYGIVYSLVVYPFAKIWGPTLQIHRLFTGIFILASCLMLVAVLKKNKAPAVVSLSGGLMLYPLLLYPTTTTPVAGPHSLGVCLFLLTVYIPFFYNYSGASLIVSLVAGLLAFYTKMYFVLGIPIMCAYLFLYQSKKKGCLYGAIFLLILLVSVILVNHCMRCYFNDTFYTQFQGANLFDGGLERSNAQIKEFYHIHKPLFYVLGIAIVIYLIGYIKNYKNLSFPNIISKIDLLRWNKPLYQCDLNLNLFSLIIVILVIYFKMGRSNGQWMAYQFQLLSPFFILFVLNSVCQRKFLTYLSIPFILFTLGGLNNHLIKNPYTSADDWQIVKKFVATHQNILNSPLIIPFLIEYQRPVYDSGQSQFAAVGTDRHDLNTKLFPPQPEVAAQFEAYLAHMHDMIRGEKFDLLLLTPPSGLNSPWTPADTDRYYKIIKTVHVRLMHSDEVFDLVVSVPRKMGTNQD